MADDRWQRVADLYQSAQDRAPEERLASFDVDSKDERFLVPTADGDRPNVLELMVNWPALLKQ
jgi:hypothetical protein